MLKISTKMNQGNIDHLSLTAEGSTGKGALK